MSNENNNWTKLVTYTIILSVINYFISNLYIYYVTIFFNDTDIFNGNIFGETINQMIYWFFVGAYIFVYISIFLFLIKMINIKDKQSFILSNVNIYLIVYILFFLSFTKWYISMDVFVWYFVFLPIISFILILWKIKWNFWFLNGSLEHNSNSSDNLANRIEQDYWNRNKGISIDDTPDMFDLKSKQNNNWLNNDGVDYIPMNSNKWDFIRDDMDDLYDIKNKSNENKDYFSWIKWFFNKLFISNDNESNIDDKNIVKDKNNIENSYLNINDVLDKNNNIPDYLNLNWEDDWINDDYTFWSKINNKENDIDLIQDKSFDNYWKSNILDNRKNIELDLDKLVNPQDDDIDELLNITWDNIEMDDNNYFKISDDEYDDNYLNIEERELHNDKQKSDIWNKVQNDKPVTISQYFIRWFAINKMQDVELIESLVHDL